MVPEQPSPGPGAWWSHSFPQMPAPPCLSPWSQGGQRRENPPSPLAAQHLGLPGSCVRLSRCVRDWEDGVMGEDL